MNKNQTALLEILKKPTLCMLPPSFPIDLKYPNIIGMLKKLGFDKVVELTYGAKMVNHVYAQYVTNHPDQKYFITSPCPTCVALVQKKYPELVQYLVPHDSPMAAMAKIAKKYFPDHNVIFISPCFAKAALEAPKYKDAIDLVVTFKELAELFNENSINENDFNGTSEKFDSFFEEDTKIYPISGGLAKTAHLSEIFDESEILITDEAINLIPAFEAVKSGTSQYRFLDILNCKGGCIGGPCLVNSKLSTEEKKQKVLDYQKSLQGQKSNSGKLESDQDLNFENKF